MEIYSLQGVSGKMQLAVKTAKQGIQLAKSDENKKAVASWEFRLGHAYLFVGKADSSYLYLNKAKQYNLAENDSHPLSQVYTELGIYHSMRNEYEKATEKLFEAIKIEKARNDKIGLGQSYNALATMFHQQNKYEKAIEYLNRALEIAEAVKATRRILLLKNNIAAMYMQKEEYHKALPVLESGLELSKKGKYVDVEANIYGNLYECYKSTNRIEEAEQALLKAQALFKVTNDKLKEGKSYAGLGDLYLTNGKIGLAIKCLQKSMDLLRECGSLNELTNTYKFMARAYSMQNKPDSTLMYLQLFGHAKDSLFAMERKSEIDRLETEFKTAEREQEMKLLKEVVRADKAELKRQTLLKWGLVAVIFLLLGMGGFVVVYFRTKAKNQKIIAGQKQELYIQKARIVGQEEERERIANDLHDGLGGTLAGIKLNLINIGSKQENSELNKAIDSLSGACQEVRAISHNMVPANLETKSLPQAIERYITNISKASEVKIGFEYSGEQTIATMDMLEQMEVYRIVQECIKNILKHSKAKQAEVDINAKNNQLNLMVVDYGKGYDTTIKQEGVGIKSIKKRTELLSGNYNITSIIDTGTTIKIEIPVSRIKQNPSS